MRRLAHHRVARRDGRRDLPRHQEQGKIERHDRRDHSERLLDREIQLVARDRRDRVPVARARDFAVVLEARRHPVDAVDRFTERLAALERHQSRQRVFALADAAPIWRSSRAFSTPGTFHQSSCAARAAATARSTSAGEQSGTVPSSASVAGLVIVRIRSDNAPIHSPLTRIRSTRPSYRGRGACDLRRCGGRDRPDALR